MNQWLMESERLIKNEENISDDIDTVKEQLVDHEVSNTEYRIYSSSRLVYRSSGSKYFSSRK